MRTFNQTPSMTGLGLINQYIPIQVIGNVVSLDSEKANICAPVLFNAAIPKIPTINNPRTMKNYYQQGREIIADTVNSNYSCVLIGGPNSGKSTTIKTYLKAINKKTSVYGVIVNDEYIDKYCLGCATYDPISPVSSISLINKTASILSDRMHRSLYQENNSSPVQLILDQWGYISKDLQSHHKYLWTDTAEKLSRIISLGKRFNIALLADMDTDDIAYAGCYSRHSGVKIIAQSRLEDSLIPHALEKFCIDKQVILQAQQELEELRRNGGGQPIICEIGLNSATFGMLEEQV